MRITNFKVADDLYLIHVALEVGAAPAPPPRVHHVVVIDVSGSMAKDLPELRQQLKKKLRTLIAQEDTLSIVWFSGRGEFGTLVEDEPLPTILDLRDVDRAIDRWLRPVGMTGFKEPLIEVRDLVRRARSRTAPAERDLVIFSLFFMTDGCDNQWDRAAILHALDEVREYLSSVTFVEYGYHADRPMLTKMAERCGGTLLFAEDFDRYQPVFEAAMTRRPAASPKRDVWFGGRPIGGFVWTQEDGELRVYEATIGTTGLLDPEAEHYACGWGIPGHARGFFFLSDRAEGTAPIFAGPADGELDDHEREERARRSELTRALYAALSLFATRMRPEVIYPILGQLGDVRLIDMFAGCFGKQQYSKFMEAAREAAFDPGKRNVRGYDPDRVPAPDAFTVLELMEILEEDGARVLLDHPDFEYERISRRRVSAEDLLTLEEQARVAAINAEICGVRDVKRVRELQAEVERILANKPVPLRFEPEKRADGYPITSLTWNEDRPNLSFKVRTEGVVDLSRRLPEDLRGVIPNPFPTFQYRDRAVIADGVVHVRALPVRVSESCARLLAQRLPAAARSKKVVVGDGWVQGVVYPTELPVLNRRMVLGESGCGPARRPSAEHLFRLQFELEKARAAQKVYKAFRDEVVPKKESPSFRELYGDRAAEWLKAAGFTEYSGFCPRSETAKSGDYYLGKVLEVKLRGYSSLPSLAEYRRQVTELESKKRRSLTPAAELMRPHVEEVEQFLSSEFNGIHDEDHFRTWIERKAEEAVACARRLLREIAQLKFAVVVGQVWFKELATIEDNSLEFDCDGVRIQGRVVMREVEIEV